MSPGSAPPDVVVPDPDDLTRPFWEAARDQRLSLQRCTACAKINHPPQVACGWCGSAELAFAAVSGRGRIASYTSELRSRNATGSSEFTALVVELEEQAGVYLVSRVPGERPAWAAVGRPVSVHFDNVPGTDVVLPQFGPDDTERSS